MALALRRLTTSVAAAVAVTAAGLWLGACDDEGGFDSGVPGNKLLDELDEDEAEAICEAAEKYRERSLPPRSAARAACVREGEVSQGDSCQRMLDECASEALDDADDDDIEDLRDAALEPISCFTVADLSGCSATVTDFEQCYQVSLTYAGREVARATCGDSASQVRLAGLGSSALSCQRLRDECPSVANLQGSGRPDEEPDAGSDGGMVEPPPDAGTVTNPTCEDLELEFDGSDCSSGGCDAVSCDCDPFARSLTTCNAVFGCVESLDCDAFCAISVSAASSCAATTDCADDGDCDLHYCVRSTGASRGVCSRGEAGDRCFEPADCDSVRCVQPDVGSGLICGGDALLGQGCDRDSDCNSGICRFDFSVTSFNGTCSNGALGALCADDGDCLSMTCTQGAQDDSTCTDRALGSQCDGDGDCDSGQCSFGGRAGGTCTAGQLGQACDADGDCDSDNCATDPVSFLRSCGYAPGDACTTAGGGAGVADCEGTCQVTAASCLAGGSCGFTPCGGGTCATWDAAQKAAGIFLSNDLLTVSTSALDDTVRATIGVQSGKWYWEVNVTTAALSANAIGVTSAVTSLEATPGLATAGVGFAQSGVLRASSGTVNADACAYGAGDVVSVALDADNAVVYFAINGVWQAGGDPGAGTGGIPVGIAAADVFPSITLSAGDVSTTNFGATMFGYEPPANYLPGLFL